MSNHQVLSIIPFNYSRNNLLTECGARCTGTRINVFWPNVGKNGSWFMATVRNMTEKGTYCVYDHGRKYYHDLYEEKYVVMTGTDGTKEDIPKQLKQKKQRAYAFDKDAIEREMKCAICLDYISEPMTIKECSHSY